MSAPQRTRDHTPDQRDCSLYYIDVLDVTTNYTTVRRNAYIGETARAPFTRFVEHLYDQPFGDIIVGHPRVDPRVFPGKDAVLAAEREAIRRLRPQYNYEENLDNPLRIPIPEARRQRAARDAARGAEPWAPPARTERGHVMPRRRHEAGGRPTGGQTLSPAWRRRRNVVAVRGSVWLVLSMLAWWAAVRWLAVPAVVAGGPVGLVVAAAMTATAPGWRTRRGLRTKTCRNLAALLLLAAVVLVASSLTR